MRVNGLNITDCECTAFTNDSLAATVDFINTPLLIRPSILVSSGGMNTRIPRSRRMMLALPALLAALTLPSAALGPHELLVLANAREPESLSVAETYMRWRDIPLVNLITLDLGPDHPAPLIEMSPESFTTDIWDPVQRIMRARGIDRHILAWAYSTHFPFRITSSPPVSLQGLTFVRNRLPSADRINDGSYVSPLFIGPDGPGRNSYGPQSFDSAVLLLRAEMPLPNMTLGYTGPNGNTTGDVLAMLKRGVAADATHPTGTVYFVTREDIRSKAREWQYASAAAGLRRLGISAVVTHTMPTHSDSILGLMTGTATVDTPAAGHFLPGAMAEHLTSFAAVFDQPSQTKLSHWIAAGATGSAGTVVEPLAYWSKFPHARFFNHYRMGCTMIESFYQAVQSPLQLMIVGEPLASPWAVTASLQIKGIEAGELLDGPRRIDLHIQAAPGTYYSRFVYLVNGRIAGEGTTFTLQPDGMPKGSNTLRAIAYQAGFVRQQVYGTVSFLVK